jgi:hypothetical protein
MKTRTPFGTAEKLGGETLVSASSRQLGVWAHRPGNPWPGSELASMSRGVFVRFDVRGDLVDCSDNVRDMDATELFAWSDDVLLTAFPNEWHVAVRAAE